MGADTTAGITEGPRTAGCERPGRWQRRQQHPSGVGRRRPPTFLPEWGRDPRRGLDPDGTLKTTRSMTQVPANPICGMDPREEEPVMADHPEDPQAEDHTEAHLEDLPTEDPRPDHRERTSQRAPGGGLGTFGEGSRPWSARST